MNRIGRFLFRFRGIIGVAGFALVFVFARPALPSLAWGLVPIALGLVLRVWAAGHIGAAGRVSEIGIEELIQTGPYRYLRNPLYVGNFLLVLGVLIALRPPWWLMLVILTAFIVEYTLIARAEANAREVRSQNYELRNPSFIIPNSYFLPGKSAIRFEWSRARSEWITLAIIAAIYLLALFRAYSVRVWP